MSGCARCASKTGDGRATSGCLREGYPTVRVVGEAIADVEQQYEVGMRAHAANAGVQEGGSKALATNARRQGVARARLLRILVGRALLILRFFLTSSTVPDERRIVQADVEPNN